MEYQPWWMYPYWRFELGPQPNPWIFDVRLIDQVMKDLAVLSTACAVAAQLSPQSREIFNQGVERLIEQMQLPEGASVEFQN
jgi:hypothetical protein